MKRIEELDFNELSEVDRLKRKYDGVWIVKAEDEEDEGTREVTRTFTLSDGRELVRKRDRVALMNEINVGQEHWQE